MITRPATPADASAIVGVDPTWTADALAATLAAPTTRAWILEADGQVVGHILTTLVADEAEIVLVAVAPSHRRRGLGARLLADAHAAWRAAGVARAWLEVRADNAPALGLYDASGWRPAGVRPRYYRDGTDAVRMSWSP